VLADLLHLLLALASVVVVGAILGKLCRLVSEPPVIGEVIAGIVLGPSLLGRIAPDAYAFLLPPAVAPRLNAVAQVGIAIYMFLIGLELNVDRVRWRARATIAISNAGIAVPFVLGIALSLYLYPRLSAPGVPYVSFALFIGTAMSITAFPVLARILADRQRTETDLGAVALTAAAVDDVSAWCLLAVVVGVSRASVESAWIVAAMTVVYIVFMLAVARPGVHRLLGSPEKLKLAAGLPQPRAAAPARLALLLGGFVLSTLVTQWIGIHAIFGAFLFGAIVPHDHPLAETLVRRLKWPVTFLLLPAFFAFAGMRTRIDLLTGGSDWLICGLIIVVASVGKIGGCFAAARASGMQFRDAAAIAFLMNTRGLMELIVLNIGLDLGVISPVLFTMMVVMALVTTMGTTPIVDLLMARKPALQSPDIR